MDTHITAVTVFPDRARVTRTGAASLEAGTHQLEVEALPLGLDPASIRARARGTSPGRIMSVDVRKTHYAETPAEEAQRLEEKLETLRRQDQALADRAESLTRTVEHLDALLEASSTYAYALSSGKTDLDAHERLLTFYREKRDPARKSFRELEGERQRLAREIEQVMRQLKEVSSALSRQRYTAQIDFETEEQGEFEFDLLYQVSGCGWAPLYDLRLMADGLETTLLGHVHQRTGEDWPAVDLTLSTAYPALAGVLPELDPWFLDEARPPEPRKVPTPAQAVMAAPAAGGESVEAATRLPEVGHATAEVRQSGASVTFRVGGKQDIPGDGAPRKVTIGIQKLDPEIDYVTTPRLADAAYRRLRTENETTWMFLSGPAQLFDREDFLGTSRMPLTAPGETFELYFGADDRFRVERELVRRDVDKSFIGDRRRIQFAYEISLENHTGESQKILARDQIPLARHEEIKVKLDSAQPKPEVDRLHRLEWALSLQPGEKSVIEFAFSVEYPRQLRIQGLP